MKQYDSKWLTRSIEFLQQCWSVTWPCCERWCENSKNKNRQTPNPTYGCCFMVVWIHWSRLMLFSVDICVYRFCPNIEHVFNQIKLNVFIVYCMKYNGSVTFSMNEAPIFSLHVLSPCCLLSSLHIALLMIEWSPFWRYQILNAPCCILHYQYLMCCQLQFSVPTKGWMHCKGRADVLLEPQWPAECTG